MQNISVIFFDIGCTLVDEARVWEARCSEQAVTEQARALGLTADDIYREIVTASVNYLPQYRTVVDKFGFTQVAPYRSELETLYPSTASVLEVLSKRYKLGVIANQTAGLLERLAAFGIDTYFTEIVSSWDCGIMKPDPELFRIAIARSGYEPAQTVMVGDRLDNDIFPAKSIGMRTVWIKQGFGGMQSPRASEYEPDETIDTLDELLEIL